MSRIIVVVGCAIAVLWGIGISQEVISEDQLGEFVSKAQNPPELTGEARIKAVLEEQLKAPFDFQEVPLVEILKVLSEDYDIPVVIDYVALDEVAISPDTEVTVNFRNISLRNAVELLLRQPGIEDLTFLIDREVLLVTTKDRANEHLITKVYRVDDLQYFVPSHAVARESSTFNPLVRMIVGCVEPNSWQSNGRGTGDVHLLRPGMLVVSQTSIVHAKLEELFDRMREVHSDISKSVGAGNDSSKRSIRGFRVDQVLAESSKDEKQLIVNAITESVEWGDESDERNLIQFVGNRILVRHEIKVLNQIEQIIDQMELHTENVVPVAAPQLSGGGFGVGFGGGGGGGGFVYGSGGESE